jgi:hypothetical protein
LCCSFILPAPSGREYWAICSSPKQTEVRRARDRRFPALLLRGTCASVLNGSATAKLWKRVEGVAGQQIGMDWIKMLYREHQPRSEYESQAWKANQKSLSPLSEEKLHGLANFNKSAE